MEKGRDRNFLHYGIRKTDLDLIRELCAKHDLNAEWVTEEILKVYHERKVDAIDMSDADAIDVVNTATHNLSKPKAP